MDDSVVRLGVAEKVLEQGWAAWDWGRKRVHVLSWDSAGGEFADGEHLEMDARDGRVVKIWPAPWIGVDVESPGPDSVEALRKRSYAAFDGLPLQAVRPLGMVRLVPSGKGRFLMGVDGSKCYRIGGKNLRKFRVPLGCCWPEDEKPGRICLVGADDWTFWPAPDGKTGLLRSQVDAMQGDCSAGPAHSIESIRPAPCSDEDFLER